jgi:hypothetical protein
VNERRELAKVGDLIDVVLGRVASSGVAPVVRLRRSWEVIAGEWADRSSPVAITGGVVTLEVASGLDASMVRYALPDLLAAVQAELGDDPPIRRIAVRVRSQTTGGSK